MSLSLCRRRLADAFVESYCAKRPLKYSSIDEVTPKLALGIGLCQCMALWPGFSCLRLYDYGRMLLGEKRALAAEYSFVAAVPIMFAATGYDLLKTWSLFTVDDIPLFATGLFSPSFSAGSPSRRLSPLWGASPCGLSPCIGCFLRRLCTFMVNMGSVRAGSGKGPF